MSNLFRKSEEQHMATTDQVLVPLPQVEEQIKQLMAELSYGLQNVPEVKGVHHSFDQNVLRVWILLDPYERGGRFAVFQLEKQLLTKYTSVDLDFYVLAKGDGSGTAELFSETKTAFSRTAWVTSKSQHLNVAFRNEKFAKSLHKTKSEYTDWMAAAAFYAAWHFVGAYLVTTGNRPPDPHSGSGDRLIMEDPVTKIVSFQYTELKNQGFNALYGRGLPTPQDVENDVLPNLDSIKTHILANLP